MFVNHNSVSNLNTDRIISVWEQNNTLLILRRLCGGYYQQCPRIIGLVDADAIDGDTVNCSNTIFC